MVNKFNMVGKKSLSSFIYVFLLAALLILGVSYVVCLFCSITMDPKLGVNYFAFDTRYGMNINLMELNNAYIEVIGVYFKKLTMFLAPCMVTAGILIYNLAMVFENFSLNMIFTKENFKKIRLVGILFIISVALYNVGAYFAAQELTKIKIAGVQFQPALKIFDINYIWGLIIIVTSEIFRRAIILNEEQELTV